MEKDWKGNQVAYVVTNGFHNKSTHDREQLDYYATEPKAAEMLLDLIQLRNVWECASGGGHLANVFAERGILGRKSDIVDRTGDTEVLDFLEGGIVRDKRNGDIVTNPPYRYAEQFIRTALDAVEYGCKVCMFLPIRYLEGKARKMMFTQFPPRYVFVSSSRIKCAINARFSEMKDSAVSYCWIVWQKGYKGATELKWFN